MKDTVVDEYLVIDIKVVGESIQDDVEELVPPIVDVKCEWHQVRV